MKLRDYQVRTVEAMKSWVNNPNTIGQAGVVVIPTGGGKSLCISELAKLVGKALVLQPSVELLHQNVDKLQKLYGITPTIFSASAGVKELSELTYATLGSIKGHARELRDLGVTTLIVDEIHAQYPPKKWVKVKNEKSGILTKSRQKKDSVFTKFLEELQPNHLIGFTATPFRIKTTMKGSMLHMMNQMSPHIIDEIIHVEQISTLMEQGFWAPLRYMYFDFDESLVKYNSTGADFTEESISEANRLLGVNENIVNKVIDITRHPKVKVLVCAESVSVAHRLNKAISGSLIILGSTPKNKREKVIEEFKNGNSRVLINVACLVTGFDCPDLTHVIIGRPIGSFMSYYQIVGRVCRPHPEGYPGYIIDYGGNVQRFGQVEHLQISDISNVGWVSHIGNKVITGVTVGSKITLDKYIEKKNGKNHYKVCSETFNFGKRFNGKRIDKVPVYYLKWFIQNINESRWNNLKETVTNYLNE